MEKVSHDPDHRDMLLNEDEYDHMQRKKGMKRELYQHT